VGSQEKQHRGAHERPPGCVRVPGFSRAVSAGEPGLPCPKRRVRDMLNALKGAFRALSAPNAPFRASPQSPARLMRDRRRTRDFAGTPGCSDAPTISAEDGSGTREGGRVKKPEVRQRCGVEARPNEKVATVVMAKPKQM